MTQLEATWQRQVEHLAELYRWTRFHDVDSRLKKAGWPDLVLLGHGRALFVELKTETGYLSTAQRSVLGDLAAAGLEVGLWRPADMGMLVRILGPKQERLAPWSGVCGQEGCLLPVAHRGKTHAAA